MQVRRPFLRFIVEDSEGGGSGDPGSKPDGDDDSILNGGDGDDTGSDDESDDDGSEGDDGGGDGDGAGATTDELVEQAVEKLQTRFESMFDKRINVVLREIRGKQTPPKPKETGQQHQDSGPTVTAEDRLDFREFLADKMPRFINADERALAYDIGGVLLAKGASPKDSADQVTSTLKGYRAACEKQVIAGLKKRGALVEREGQPGKQGAGVSKASEFARGAELAKARYGPPTTKE